MRAVCLGAPWSCGFIGPVPIVNILFPNQSPKSSVSLSGMVTCEADGSALRLGLSNAEAAVKALAD